MVFHGSNDADPSSANASCNRPGRGLDVRFSARIGGGGGGEGTWMFVVEILLNPPRRAKLDRTFVVPSWVSEHPDLF